MRIIRVITFIAMVISSPLWILPLMIFIIVGCIKRGVPGTVSIINGEDWFWE